MKICTVIASLGPGGAERVLLELCRAWAGRGDAVTLVTLSNPSSDHYVVPAGVERVALDVLGPSTAVRALGANVSRIRALRRIIATTGPDVVVSFIDRTNVRTLLATRGLGIPVVVSERNDPRECPIGRFWSPLRHVMYPRANALVVQTTSLRPWGEEYLPPARVHVIPNPVRLTAPETALLSHETRASEIVAMGRLVEQKGFDLLIDAFAMVQPEFPQWRLRVVGDGPDRAALEKQARTRLPASAIVFHGRTTDPDRILMATPVFVLSSRHEGFPNVLLEAMQSGCACVATDCPCGPSELITSGLNGVLVAPNCAEAIADGLRSVLREESWRRSLGAAARESVGRFALETIVKQWDSTFAVAGIGT